MKAIFATSFFIGVVTLFAQQVAPKMGWEEIIKLGPNYVLAGMAVWFATVEQPKSRREFVKEMTAIRAEQAKMREWDSTQRQEIRKQDEQRWLVNFEHNTRLWDKLDNRLEQMEPRIAKVAFEASSRSRRNGDGADAG